MGLTVLLVKLERLLEVIGGEEICFAIRFPKKQTGTHCCDDLTPKGNGRYFEKDFFKIYNKFETLLKKYENKRFE